MKTFDLANGSVRALNQCLHAQQQQLAERTFRVLNPKGAHNIACGIDADISVEIQGHAGYYCAGMNKTAQVTVLGNAGQGLAENMMSGTVRVAGSASSSAGASAHGGLLVIKGSAAARCGISLKGANIVVGGDVGHMSAFMAQAGCLVVCGNAAEALGDSLYETRIYVQGEVKSLGADCIEKPMGDQHVEQLGQLLKAAGFAANPSAFKRYGSARQLYNFKVDNTY